MADASQPEIAAAYEDVRSDKTETNWLVLKYETDRSDKLKLAATGTGGLADLRSGEHFGDGDAAFAYARVTYANDKESTRQKFILITWIGKNAKPMRKGKMSVHLADVKKVLRTYSIEVSAREADDLAEDPIVTRLRKAGGASYDGV